MNALKIAYFATCGATKRECCCRMCCYICNLSIAACRTQHKKINVHRMTPDVVLFFHHINNKKQSE